MVTFGRRLATLQGSRDEALKYLPGEQVKMGVCRPSNVDCATSKWLHSECCTPWM